MAENEVGLNIPVSAVVDEKKTEKELDKLEKSVNKKGRIEIPVDITVPIDKSKDTLTKAQQTVINKLNKMTSTGFSASGKDIDDLTSKFKKLTKALDESGKGRQNKIFREIRKQVEEVTQAYKALNAETKNIKTRKKSTSTKGTSGAQISNEEVKANIKANQKRKSKSITDTDVQRNIKDFNDQLNEGIEQITSQLNFKKQSGVNAGTTNDYELMASERSPYASSMARDMAQSFEEMAPIVAKSLVSWVDKESANNAPTSDTSKTTSLQESKAIADKALNEIPKIISQLEKGVSDINVGTLVKQVFDAFNKSITNGYDPEQAFNAINAEMESVYFNNPAKKRLGGTNGEEKGVGKNHDYATEAIKETLDLLKKFWQLIPPEVAMAKKYYQDTGKSMSVAEMKEALSGVQQSLKESLSLESTGNKTTKSQAEKAYIQSVRESSREASADTAEGQINKSIKAAAETDLETGFNNDANSEKVISLLEQALSGTAKGFTNFGGNDNGGNGGEPPEEGGEGIYSSALNTIIELLSQISINTSKGIEQKQDLQEETEAIQDTKDEKESADTIKNMLQKSLQPLLPAGETIKALASATQLMLPAAGETTKTGFFPNEEQERAAYREAHIKEAEPKTDTFETIASERTKILQTLDRLSGKNTEISDSSMNTFADKLKSIFSGLKYNSEAARLNNMSSTEQDRIQAERLQKFGANRDRTNSGVSTGIRSDIEYRKNFWNRKDEDNPVTLNTKGYAQDVNVEDITAKLAKALNQGMFEAQTGGALRNIVGSMTGYVGMPSLEKSRAQAEGLNEVMAQVRQVFYGLIEDIRASESKLKGMVASGDATFDASGNLTSGTPEAKQTLAQYEEYKLALQGVLVDTEMIDQVVDSTGGKISSIVQQLGFTSPELRKCNTILENINSGLNKNGQALKFQTRTGEILNYSFQLMARNIGQMFKNWISMLNPINLIKQAFSDFASYDTKWQRTMNVIKYNLRRIIKPFMEWLAQQLVNIIGLVNALLKGIGKVFGQNWDLFDQAAAATEQMEENLEAAANVSAGFDELHDISSETNSSSAADDLTGDIYTPQWDSLYEKLEAVGEKIGTVFKNIGETIQSIFDKISNLNFWDWLKLAGAALLGWLVLKTIINLFTGKNPLQSVADGVSYLLKAFGKALLIEAFADFVEALADFMEVMIDAEWEDVAQALITLGGAFALLFAGIAGIEGITKWLNMDWKELFGLSALVSVFALFVDAITPFIEVISGLGTDAIPVIAESLITLGLAFVELIAGVAGIEKLTKVIGLDWTSLLGLAAVIGVFDLFVAALTPLVAVVADIEDNERLLTLGTLITVLASSFIILIEAVSALGGVSGVITDLGTGAIPVLSAIVLLFDTVILSLAVFVKALDGSGDDIQMILEGIGSVIESVGNVIVSVLETVTTFISDVVIAAFQTAGDIIVGIVTAVGETITGVIDAIGNVVVGIAEVIGGIITTVIQSVTELAGIIAHEIGETIRTIVETVGNVIVEIVNALIDAIPTLLNAILDFVNEVGPAIENLATSLMNTITKIINFLISGIEYMINTLVIGSINSFLGGLNKLIPGESFDFNLIQSVSIPRFVPQYEQGTNYVPNDGLAYLHEGEAVIPKKYNQPLNNTGLSAEERAYMTRLMSTMSSLDNTMKQGITVNGQFTQKGSDLVAVVNKVSSRKGATLLSNSAYAR